MTDKQNNFAIEPLGPPAQSAMSEACRFKSLDKIHALLFVPGARYDWSETDEQGRTPLLSVVSPKSWESPAEKNFQEQIGYAQRIAAKMIQDGADPFLRTEAKGHMGASFGKTKMHPSAAAKAFELGMVPLVMAAASAKTPQACLASIFESNPGAHLAAAAWEAGDALLRCLFELGFEPEPGQLADMAASCCHEKALDFLFEKGADPNGLTSRGASIAESLSARSGPAAAKVLARLVKAQALRARQAPAAIPASEADQAQAMSEQAKNLFFAADNGAPSSLMSLLKTLKQKPDVQDETGRTLLMRALASGKFKTAAKLIENGADPCFPDPQGLPAFSYGFLASRRYTDKRSEKAWDNEKAAFVGLVKANGWHKLPQPGGSLLDALANFGNDAAKWSFGAPSWRICMDDLLLLSRENPGLGAPLFSLWSRLLGEKHALWHYGYSGEEFEKSHDRYALDSGGEFCLAQSLISNLLFATDEKRNWERGLEPDLALRALGKEGWRARREGPKPYSPSKSLDALGRSFPHACLGLAADALLSRPGAQASTAGDQIAVLMRVLEDAGYASPEFATLALEQAADRSPGEALGRLAAGMAKLRHAGFYSRSPNEIRDAAAPFSAMADKFGPGQQAAFRLALLSNAPEIIRADPKYAQACIDTVKADAAGHSEALAACKGIRPENAETMIRMAPNMASELESLLLLCKIEEEKPEAPLRRQAPL